MITVSILINNEPLYTRTAVNQSKKQGEKTKYLLDSGKVIWHDRADGSVALAKKMLDDIHSLVK